ncbi:Rax1p KNAG_0G03100 [Huiozyma naganishii CBS 8797]|uniref:RGS domain-containing protein n=1 Tax=Huiozyma naganishii (strain ATCC MYA-139 / BCRC 22969 / CBS 8797 / KCTC 17520 / NBRC 10181 / NCYC 3082 / Yp74L-3) TaxID=1071383 RepID=J7S1A2_HUIN7|nr:hypothetical protein KNAG_0G03100 [Kazachstania naganishii CBS 8797]CCK71367.1 hypothetical protein KNAG_0G03100 [Kazachstania naganishii CBS 8797]
MDRNFAQIQKERLPTLYEVLIQKSGAPLDLWSFYTYLSQFPFAINYLDFWIDLMAHIRLCKDFIKGVRRSIGEAAERNEEQQGGGGADDTASVTTSVLMQTIMEEAQLDLNRPDDVYSFFRNSHQQDGLGDNLRASSRYSARVSQMLDEWNGRTSHRYTGHSVDISNGNLTTLMDEFLNEHSKTRGDGGAYITTKQLLHNATHMCRTYLISREESERYLTNIPTEIREYILVGVLDAKKYDPGIFDDLKTLTYQFLEIDCFPKFLSQVALHNLHDEISNWRFNKLDSTKYSGGGGALTGDPEKDAVGYRGAHTPFSNYTTLSRILFGLLWLGIGFWIGYTLIFLKYSRAIRVVTVVPFALGCYYCICGLYQVDIIYSIFGVTQRLLQRETAAAGEDPPTHTDATTAKVPSLLVLFGGRGRLLKIEHEFTRRLLLRRGLWCLLLVTFSTAAFTVIFSCVPGYRV